MQFDLSFTKEVECILNPIESYERPLNPLTKVMRHKGVIEGILIFSQFVN